MDEKKVTIDDRLILEENTGESVHVPPTAFAAFEAMIDASLDRLVARWASLASPQARRQAAIWRR